MNLFVLTLIGGIVIRTILDLSSLDRSSHIFDALYVGLFAVMGAVMLVQNSTDIFGYVSFVVAIGWGGFGFYKYKKSKRS
jgi:hypothetical protein